MISAVDYESHFDNKYSVDKFSILANERFETKLDLENISRSIESRDLKRNCTLHLKVFS